MTKEKPCTERNIKAVFEGTIQMVIDTVQNDIAYFNDKEAKHKYIQNVSNNLIKSAKEKLR